MIVATQSNSAADLIAQRLIAHKGVDSKLMVRLISRNYAMRSNAIPDELTKFGIVRTIDELEPDKSETRYKMKCLLKLQKYKVVVGTLSTITHLLESKKLRNSFTHALIDEAGQCTEPRYDENPFIKFAIANDLMADIVFSFQCAGADGFGGQGRTNYFGW